jgi:DNA-binding beta-propeller fold protein YncE
VRGVHRAVVVLALLLSACATENPGVDPVRNRFYFPSALALDGEWPILYLANANADLKYNGGTVNMIQLDRLPGDLTKVGAAVNAGTIACHADPYDPTIWECYEEQFINPNATIRTGNFPADLQVSVPSLGSQVRQRRLFVPVRGDNVLLWAVPVRNPDGTFDLRCAKPTGACAPEAIGDCPVWDCDDDISNPDNAMPHKVDYSPDRLKQLPQEPFGIEYNPLVPVWIDKDGNRRTCLDQALPAVSCDCNRVCCSETDTDCCLPPPSDSLDCPAACGNGSCDTRDPQNLETCSNCPQDCGVCTPSGQQQVSDHLYVTHALNGELSFFTSDPSGVFLRDFRNGFFTPVNSIAGAFALATRRPGDSQSLTYASSKVDTNLASFRIMADRRLIDATRASVGGVISPANDVRGLAFGPGGDQLYVANRQPSTLIAMDMTAASGSALPRQQPLWAVPVCTEPSLVRLGPDPSRPEQPLARLAYVVCFSAGQIFVVDTANGEVIDQIVTGKGPNGLVIDSKNNRAFVANYLDNTIGVIDLDPSHPSYNRMVLRIGRNQYLIRTQ